MRGAVGVAAFIDAGEAAEVGSLGGPVAGLIGGALGLATGIAIAAYN